MSGPAYPVSIARPNVPEGESAFDFVRRLRRALAIHADADQLGAIEQDLLRYAQNPLMLAATARQYVNLE